MKVPPPHFQKDHFIRAMPAGSGEKIIRPKSTVGGGGGGYVGFDCIILHELFLDLFCTSCAFVHVFQALPRSISTMRLLEPHFQTTPTRNFAFLATCE